MNDNDPSILRNRHEDLPPPEPPKPLSGEVKAGASDPDQEEAVSVRANMPEDVQPVTAPEPLEGEVAPGASEPNTVPPSVAGTSYAPKET